MGNILQVFLRLTDLAVLVATEGAAALKQYNELKSRLEQMTAEGRNPTDAEFAELLADTNDLSRRLAAADKKLNG